MFVVESNVPISKAKENRGRKSIYPFSQMGVGDSFEFEGDEAERGRVASASRNWGKDRGILFATKRTGYNKFRCWRIA